MKILEFDQIEEFETLSDQQKEDHVAFIFKNVVQRKGCDQIKSEIVAWSRDQPQQDSKNPYPEGVYNVHLRVRHNQSAPKEHLESPMSSDFHEIYTNVDVINYRIGWIDDPMIQEKAPSFNAIGKELLTLYGRLTGTKFPHGKTGEKNLHFEFARYPLGSGYIEKHTHFRSIGNGQRWNLMLVLSQDGEDHNSAGLKFEYQNETIDTRKMLDKGDVILFRLDVPHFVDQVEPAHVDRAEETSGRWTMGMFYY